MKPDELIESILQKAPGKSKRIALPEATDENMLLAAKTIFEKEWGYPVLVGDPAEIAAFANSKQICLDGVGVFDATDEVKKDELIRSYSSRHTLFSDKALHRKAKDPLNYSMMLLDEGLVDCAFAGIVYSTKKVVDAATGLIGLAEGVRVPCSMGLHYVPDLNGKEGTFYCIGDSSMCVSPDDEMLADISITYCDAVSSFLGWTPRAAMLSYSTLGSGSGKDVTKVQEAVAIANKRRPDLFIEGEFQFDAAINPRVAAKKVSAKSEVAGKANTLVFPDINAGNIGWKMMQEFGHSEVVCLMIFGFAKPVGDCSRGDTSDVLARSMAMLLARS